MRTAPTLAALAALAAVVVVAGCAETSQRAPRAGPAASADMLVRSGGRLYGTALPTASAVRSVSNTARPLFSGDDFRPGDPPFGGATLTGDSAYVATAPGFDAPIPNGDILVHDIPGRRLDGAEIAAMASGNTVVGPRLSIHYRADGTATLSIFNDLREGRWRVDDNMMCHQFADFAPWAAAPVCYEWYWDGANLSTFQPNTGAGATRGENTVVAGNAL